MPANPFTPRSGVAPTHLIGREDALESLEAGIGNAPRDPHSVTFVTGARGTGKTVLLLRASDMARKCGWVVINTFMGGGFLDRLTLAVDDLLDAHLPKPKRGKGIGIQVLGTGGSAQLDERVVPKPRTLLGKLELLLEQKGIEGVLITVDEVQAGRGRDDFATFGHDIQIMQGRGLPVAVFLAGLPTAVDETLRDRDGAGVRQPTTFLRRAERVHLGAVPVERVEDEFARVFRPSAEKGQGEVVRAMASATGGYPFLIQLIGYWVWQKAKGDLTREAATQGVDAAIRRLGSLVHQTALADLSDVDKTFLLAMSRDDGTSSIGDVARRMQAPSTQYVNTYRLRLLAADMIVPLRRGYYTFAMPWMREYLRDHAAVLGITEQVAPQAGLPIQARDSMHKS